jgi:M6 family metalloprotease-like protein
MKKIISIVLIFTFLNVSLAEATVKSGASCSKINATSTVSGYKYTCIKSGKKLVWNKGVAIKKLTPVATPTVKPTPEPSTSSSPTPTPTPTSKTDDVYTGPSDLTDSVDLCKIKETNLTGPRMAKGWNAPEAPIYSIPSGFPAVTPLMQRNGTLKWALIPIDFPDLAGEKNFRSRVDEQMKLLSEWYSTVSEGKLKIEWVVLNKWVTVPGKSTDYVTPLSANLNSSSNNEKLFKDALRSADPHFDFTNVKTINFLLPEAQTVVTESIQGFPWDKALQGAITNEGAISSFSMAGAIFFKPDREIWSYWAHEFGHAIAIPHVGASRNSSPFQVMDIMGNEGGITRELSGWLRFVAGWMSNEKIFCKTKDSLKQTKITLVPLSSEKDGVKMAVIPVSDTKAVVIESRRSSKFSCKNPIIGDGVLVYTYDGSLTHGQEFLKPIYPNDRPVLRSTCLTPPSADLLLHEGDKVIVEGITIEVLAHGNYDKIIVSKK